MYFQVPFQLYWHPSSFLCQVSIFAALNPFSHHVHRFIGKASIAFYVPIIIEHRGHSLHYSIYVRTSKIMLTRLMEKRGIVNEIVSTLIDRSALLCTHHIMIKLDDLLLTIDTIDSEQCYKINDLNQIVNRISIYFQ